MNVLCSIGLHDWSDDVCIAISSKNMAKNMALLGQKCYRCGKERKRQFDYVWMEYGRWVYGESDPRISEELKKIYG